MILFQVSDILIHKDKKKKKKKKKKMFSELNTSTSRQAAHACLPRIPSKTPQRARWVRAFISLKNRFKFLNVTHFLSKYLAKFIILNNLLENFNR